VDVRDERLTAVSRILATIRAQLSELHDLREVVKRAHINASYVRERGAGLGSGWHLRSAPGTQDVLGRPSAKLIRVRSPKRP
jgi:hypothetical protein